MKKIIFITLQLVFVCQLTVAQDFVTIWERQLGTGAGSGNIVFNCQTAGTVSYTWQTLAPASLITGSGTFSGTSALIAIDNVPLSFPPAKIRLSIQPQNLRRFSIPEPFQGGETYAIIDVSQWGAVPWTSFENAFANAAGSNSVRLESVSAIDIPNLTNVTNMSNMFKGCQSLNTPFNINFWNMSNVTNISGMFSGCSVFNQALSQWNTTNITNMSDLFKGAAAFNQNITGWNTANVTNMSGMFEGARIFNRAIGVWNTSKVTNMSRMFADNLNIGLPYLFNQNIGNWNTTLVTNMSEMFQNASNFNQNIGAWITNNVTNMSGMFQNARSFNQNIGNWNTANVSNMANMFSNDVNAFGAIENYAFSNGGSVAIQNWNTANVTNMSGMFLNATNFNSNLGGWALNPSVNLTTMLDNSGLNCTNYSSTLISWNANPNTPNNKILGAIFLNYGSQALPAITNMVVNKGWGFSGHDIIAITPTFTIPVAICSSVATPTLPTTSNNGITGTWSPSVINNQVSGSYTFTPNPNQCAENFVLNVTVAPVTPPTFTIPTTFCLGSTPGLLPTTSNNGITGTWLPNSISNQSSGNYVFTPTVGQCSTIFILNVTVSSLVQPSFNFPTAICSGGNLTALPTTSSNGITGVWSPALNNLATTTYTFTPNSGQCASSQSISIIVNPVVTPNFTAIPPICSGGNIVALPTTSINGIAGTWSPALNNLATTTYTFTPNSGQCATSANVTIVVNSGLSPTFTQVAPICFGGMLNPLPTTSINGITGTWSPTLNNSITTTYTFTPSSGQCEVTMTIVVNGNEIPNFAAIAPICSGGTLAPLPMISTNGITGIWSPALNNLVTTTYTFTANEGQCTATQTLTIIVNPLNATPTGNSNQTFNSNSTLSNVIINPSNVIWYASVSDALTNVNPLSSSTLLTNNTTYYAVNNNGSCRSQPFAVTANLTLGINEIDKQFLKIHPNPVTSVLQISYANAINSFEIYSVLGQLLISKKINSFTYSIDMSHLANDLYILKIKSENKTGVFKILKE